MLATKGMAQGVDALCRSARYPRTLLFSQPPQAVKGTSEKPYRKRHMPLTLPIALRILLLLLLFSLGGLKYRQNREAGVTPAQSHALL